MLLNSGSDSSLPKKSGGEKKEIALLSKAAGLDEILRSLLSNLDYSIVSVDYSRPVQPQIKNAEVLVNGLGRVDRMMIDSCPNLKLVQQIGTGTDNVDLEYCSQRCIHVAHVPKVNSVAVAEHTLFLMIYLAKNIKGAGRGILQRRVLNVLGSELYGKTLLVVGLGYIGAEVAKRALAFGMNVIAVTRHPESKVETIGGTRSDQGSELSGVVPYTFQIFGIDKLPSCLGMADYVSIHADLNSSTQGMISKGELAHMRSGSYLINVSRASLVDRAALLEYLTERKIAGAAFDVFWDEPADPDDPLLQLDNFVLTPHVAGWTRESATRASELICKNIELVSRGLAPLYAVDLLPINR